jgi:SH3 domain protein
VHKINRLFILLLFTVGVAQAETLYVTDKLELVLRKDASNEAQIIKSLPVGTPLTNIGKKSKSGFIRVRLSNGIEGYILTRHTQKEPPEQSPSASLGKDAQALQAENNALKAELKVAKDAIAPGTTLEKSLALERDKLSQQLIELEKSASGIIELKNERDELQERVVNAERELEQYKRENQSLKDTSNQDWFLYGGMLTFISVILGSILPKLGWRRKSSWDSF